MFVDHKKLNRSFSLMGLFLYAFGFSVAFNVHTRGAYIRYLDDGVSRLRNAFVVQNQVNDYFSSIDGDYITYQNDEGVTYTPYISYGINHSAINYYSNGAVYFNMVDVDYLNDDFNSYYLGYFGNEHTIGRSNNDIGEFEYNNVAYSIIDFLTVKDSNGNYAYNTLYQYGYSGSMTYANQYGLDVSITFDFKLPSASAWTSCNLYSAHFNDYLVEDDFNYSFVNHSYNNSDLVDNLNYSLTALNSFNNGIQSVLDDPHAYNLYTYSEYLSYGNLKYNNGLEDGSNALSMAGVMNTIFSAPINMFMAIFTSRAFVWTLPTGEVLDLGGLMTFLLTIGIALAIVRLIMKVGGK